MDKQLRFALPFLSIVLGLTRGALNNDIVAQDLFENLDKKSSPLYSCRGWIDGIKWRVPPTMQCPLVSTNNESKLVGVTFWSEDITMAPVKAYECYAIKETVTKEWFFFGGHNEKRETKKEDIKLSDCHLMINTMKSPDGSPMERIQDDFMGTVRTPEVIWKWASLQSDTKINYYYIGLTVAISNVDSSIQTNTKLLESCKYTKGHCRSDLGLLTWKVNDHFTCRLKKGSSTVCLLTEGRMTCPELEIAVTGINTVSICNMTFGTSLQGLIFTQNDLWSQLLDIKFETTAYAESTILRIKKTGKFVTTRKKRNVPGVSAMSAAQVNGKLQWLYQTVKENQNVSIQQIHSEICRSNKNQLETLRILAQGGSVSLLVRVLLGDNTYRARMNGDILSVFKCQEIFNYMMVPRNSCISEWPVVFMEDNEKHFGYVSPLSHEITYTPTTVPCPAQDFYFDDGKSVVLLTNKTVVSNLPTLPKPSDSFNISLLPTLSFKTPGVYNLADMSGGETLVEIVRSMQNRYQIDDAIRTQREGGTLRSDQMDILGTIRRFTIDPIRNLVTSILSSFFVMVFLGFVILLTIKHFPTIKKKLLSFTQKNVSRNDKESVADVELVSYPTPSAPVQDNLYPVINHDEYENYSPLIPPRGSNISEDGDFSDYD